MRCIDAYDASIYNASMCWNPWRNVIKNRQLWLSQWNWCKNLSLDNQTYTSAKVAQKEKTVTLVTLHSTLNIDNEVVNINPLILFSQLIFLAESGEETTPWFEYELANYPFTLLKDGMMRNGNKASLRSFLMEGIPTQIYLQK